MRIRTAVALGAAITIVTCAWTWARSPSRPAVQISISATRTPTPGRPWRFAISAITRAGRPVASTAIVRVLVGNRVVDTIGWFGFKGTLHRSYRWPVALAGSSATLRVTVPVGHVGYAGSFKVRVADTTGRPRFNATLSGGGRAPTPGTPWPYVLRISRDGRPIDATAVVRIIGVSQVLDTIGWFQARGRLEGVYRWPRNLRGQTVALQATVLGPGGTRTVTYRLRVRR